jgi:hypothetical protein
MLAVIFRDHFGRCSVILGAMRPLPAAPEVSGDTPAERLSNALNRVLKVSKADLLKEEARFRRASEKKRAKKSP